jgi:YhcN/YlaJ family sporulation lipoprotein
LVNIVFRIKKGQAQKLQTEKQGGETMKNKRILLILSLLLVVSLLISGCPPFRRPVPERQPVPDQQAPQGQVPAPQPTDPAPGPGVQPRTQPGPNAMDLANRVSDLATDVQGVDNAVVVVISNLALVGITLERNNPRNDTEVKQEVASTIEDREPSIVNAYVSASPDIVRQLEQISRGIQRGEPISTFFDQITEVLRRMRAESGNN